MDTIREGWMALADAMRGEGVVAAGYGVPGQSRPKNARPVTAQRRAGVSDAGPTLNRHKARVPHWQGGAEMCWSDPRRKLPPPLFSPRQLRSPSYFLFIFFSAFVASCFCLSLHLSLSLSLCFGYFSGKFPDLEKTSSLSPGRPGRQPDNLDPY